MEERRGREGGRGVSEIEGKDECAHHTPSHVMYILDTQALHESNTLKEGVN